MVIVNATSTIQSVGLMAEIVMISMRNTLIVQLIIPLVLVMVIVNLSSTMQSVDLMAEIAMIAMRNTLIVQPIMTLSLELVMEGVNVTCTMQSVDFMYDNVLRRLCLRRQIPCLRTLGRSMVS